MMFFSGLSRDTVKVLTKSVSRFYDAVALGLHNDNIIQIQII